jgi:hypothetical protein
MRDDLKIRIFNSFPAMYDTCMPTWQIPVIVSIYFSSLHFAAWFLPLSPCQSQLFAWLDLSGSAKTDKMVLKRPEPGESGQNRPTIYQKLPTTAKNGKTMAKKITNTARNGQKLQKMVF